MPTDADDESATPNPVQEHALGRCLAAEFLGSYALVFAGTGAIVIDSVTGGVIGHAGIALTFGLVVMAMISAIGDVSGAHINPAVSIAFTAAGRFPVARLVPYVVVQIAGALAASGTLRLLFPDATTLGQTLPHGSWQQSFVLEVILTFFLMWVILHVSSGAAEKGIIAGTAIGSVVALEAMFAGPICGASMNPARSFGPAIVSGQLDTLWVYIVAPAVGALLAIPAFYVSRTKHDLQPDM